MLSQLLWLQHAMFLFTNAAWSNSVVNWSYLFHDLTTQQCQSMVLGEYIH